MTRTRILHHLAATAMAFCLATAFFSITGCESKSTVTVATTADIAQSEMYAKLVEEFEKASGVTVTTEVFDNSAAALEAAAQGLADALVVGKAATSEEWVNNYALSSSDVFYNEFMVVGPEADPAMITGLDCPGKSCKKIGTAGEEFVACGDGSDLGAKVMGYWAKCGVNPNGQAWFTQTGSGVPATLDKASELQAYTICDTSTWLQVKDGLQLTKLVTGCGMLLNQYVVVVVNPDVFPEDELNTAGAEEFAKFVLGEDGQAMIGAYQEAGVVIYHPNATRQAEEQPMNM
jgi:tungstate transport system substrate-binding protein